MGYENDYQRSIRRVLNGRYIVDFDLGSKIVKYNKGFCEMTGYTPVQLDNGDIVFDDLIPDEDKEAYFREVKLVQQDGGGTLEHRIKCADGSYIDVICIGEDFVDENGHSCANINISEITERAALQRDNERSHNEIATIIDSIPGGVVVYKLKDDKLFIVRASQEYYHIFGAESDEMSDDQLFDIDHTEYEKLVKSMKECVKTQTGFEQELHFADKEKWIKFIVRYFDLDEDGGGLLYCSVIDISESKLKEKELEKQGMCLKLISDNTDEVFFEYDIKKDIFKSTSHKLKEAFGDDSFENFIKNRRSEKYLQPEDIEVYYNTWRMAINSPCSGRLDYRTKAYDGDYRWYRMVYVSISNDDNKATNVFGMIQCIDHLKVMKSKLADDRREIEKLSNTDYITGLYNRNAFKNVASDALDKLYTDSSCFALVYSDINDFSYINENFGYEAGDAMLKDFADTISDSDVLIAACRIYSDYFVSLCCAKNRDKLIDSIAERNKTFTANQRSKYPLSDIQISTGIYFVKSRDEDITIGMDNANLARRTVKGTNNIPSGVYTERMRKKRSHDQTIASEIWNALNSGAIELFLQPKFDLTTREIIGAEALTRWRNTDGTYKLPYEFIDVLENVGYITQVDMYIYEQVLKCLAKWKKEGKKLIPISVNFSRKHNNNSDFVDKVNALANIYGVDKNLIEIEVTESCFTQDVKNLFSNMRRLREQGFKIDIDDFGTGYSSLSVLIDAPVDIVKVDKVFIDDIGTSERSREYINQICSLIQSTRKDIIFEGVETEEQAKILSESGHTMAQGWLFDKAIPVNEFYEKYM